MRDILLGYGIFAMFYIMVVYCIYFFIMTLSFANISRIIKGSSLTPFDSMSGSAHVPPVSILVPSYNEELTIIENVRSLLSLNYPEYEVIVINDGSQDNTLQVLIDEFNLKFLPNHAERRLLDATPINGVYHNPDYPSLYVIDKRNGGKADSLNAGINLSHYPLICTIDADSLLEKDALIRIARVYMENPDETVAIGGSVRIANGCTIEDGIIKKVRLPDKILPMFQNIEYLKAFLGGRIGWSSINALLIVSGAFGVFRKDYVVKVGGYREGFPGEDMNIIIKLHRYMLENKLPYRIAFCPDAVCWTQAPDSFRILTSQRKRWGRGNIKNMWDYRFMVFNPKYKQVGLLTMPYNVIFETLNPYFKITGFFALLGYFLMDMTALPIVLTFVFINMLINMIFTCGALLLEELAFRRYPRVRDLVIMAGCSVLMTLGYDQLNAIWRFLGQIDFIRNKRTWGVMVRKSWKGETVKS